MPNKAIKKVNIPPNTFKLIERFFEKTLNQEAVIPVDDAKKVAKDFAALCEKVLTWSKE